MLGPVFLLVAIVLYIILVLVLKSRVLDSLIQGGRTWERGSTAAKTRALAFTIVAVLSIMGTALGVEAVVETIQNAL